MDPFMDVIKNSEEPEWLENNIVGGLRVWQLIFLCLAGVTGISYSYLLPSTGFPSECELYDIRSLTQPWLTKYLRIFLPVIVCCCFRFRIPRTKQQIEADYQRRKITSKFRQQLETIQDSKMDAMSLHDALELLHEKTNKQMDYQPGSQPSSISPEQSSLDATVQPDGQKAEPQSSGPNFVKFATKVANLSKLGPPKPTPTTSEAPKDKMDF